MMHKKHLLLSLLVITFCILFFTAIGCESNNDVSPEQIEPEENVDSEPEEVVIEQEPEPEEIAEDVSDEDELEPEIKAVVNVDILRLRSGPSTDYEILDRLIKGRILKVVGEQDEWLQVVLPYQEGWVHGDYVSIPEDPEKLYEVLAVEVQPVGYTKEEVASFIERSTSFRLSPYLLPEFNHPNDIDNDDLIDTTYLNRLTPEYQDFRRGSFVTGKDIQKTARAIFGSDLKEIEHRSVTTTFWDNEKQVYYIAYPSGNYTKTRVLNIVEKEKKFVVDVVHLVYYYSPYGEDYNYLASEVSRHIEYDSRETFLDNNLDLLVNTKEMIEQHIKTFPVRRYILSKEGDGILYIRQSYMLDD